VTIVVWKSPDIGYIKCNIDGATCVNLGLVACASIFYGSKGEFVGGFYSFLGNDVALKAELLGAMLVIEVAVIRGWNSLWLESDWQLTVGGWSILQSFHGSSV